MDRSINMLKDIWKRCFPDQARIHADARVQAEAEWSSQRPRHLPCTRNVLLGSLEANLRFGSDQRTEGEPTLLLMVGYSPEQLALVIATQVARGCKKVVPFTGHGVWNAVQPEVVDCLRILDIDDHVLVDPVEVDPSSPADVFRRIVAWIRQHPESRCALDCTGGKKPMDSGAARAASFYGLPAYYLDFDGYDPVLRRPRPWTCRYRELPLPDDVFGLANRTRVLEAFRNGRYAEADQVLDEVFRHAQATGLFDDTDLTDLHHAKNMVAQAASWMNLRYDEIPGHPLADIFRQAEQEEPRGLVAHLLDRSRFDELSVYLADEYWRLGLLCDAGQKREALVGYVGLAELAVDGMFRAPWFSAVRVASATALEWSGVADDLPLPDLISWKGRPFPLECLPPSSFSSKIRLLRRGTATFEVWAWKTQEGADLRAPPPGWNDPRLVTRLDVTLDSDTPPPLGNLSNSIWKQYFGDFPQGGWSHLRHALVHLRAPLLSREAVEEVERARDVFVPHLIEVLRRLHLGERIARADIEQPDWLGWLRTPPWRREDRLPWCSRVSDLERWLRLGV